MLKTKSFKRRVLKIYGLNSSDYRGHYAKEQENRFEKSMTEKEIQSE